jgi:hypothetical protein
MPAWYAVNMNNPREMSISLKDLVFFREMPVLLGVSDNYAKNLCAPPNGKNAAYFHKLDFPAARLVLPSGIRVWWRTDVERWAFEARRRGGYGVRRNVAILDDRALADRILGRAPRAR